MARQRESFLTTTQGVTLAKDDLVAFYMDPKLKAAPYYGVGCNVMVLKHAVSGNQVTNYYTTDFFSSTILPHLKM